jgi:hypothetical protein
MRSNVFLSPVNISAVDAKVCDKTCVFELWRDAFKALMKWERSYAERTLEAVFPDAQNYDKTCVIELSKTAFESLIRNIG